MFSAFVSAAPIAGRAGYLSGSVSERRFRVRSHASSRIARRRVRSTTTAVAAYPVPTGIAGECSAAVRSVGTIPELFRMLATRYGDSLALVDEHRAEDSRAQLTYVQLDEKIRQAIVALRRLGVNQGDVLAVFAENSHHWLIVDQAIMGCGAATAVRGADAPLGELQYIYTHSGSRMLFVEDNKMLNRLLEQGKFSSRPDLVVLLFGKAERNYPFPVMSFEELLAKGSNGTEAESALVGNADDIATLLYTSGTTGQPKGVVLKHSNIMFQVGNLTVGRIDPKPGDVFVAVLPIWHIFERTAGYYCYAKGMTVVYSNRRRFREDLGKHRPHVIFGVPRVFESLHASVMSKLKSASEARKKLFAFFSTVSLAFIYASRRMRGLSLKSMSYEPNAVLELGARAYAALKYLLLLPLYALANLLIWRKIRAALGGRVQVCICGGGLLAGHLEDFFEAAKVEICVGYGLTETSPVICNRFAEHNVRGTAGPPMKDTQVKIKDVEDGRLLPKGSAGVIYAKGPSVFSRYYQNAEATQKAFDEEGYFDTGDLGYIAPSGDLVITGRTKDVIVLSNGENVEPAPIEDAILSSPLIDQVMLVGQDERALGALVVPRLDALLEHQLIDDGLHQRARELLTRPGDNSAEIRALEMEMGLHPYVYNKLMDEISHRNEARDNYSRTERISGFRVVLTPFSVENGMMTQTFKIKKATVADKMHSHIRSLFDR